MLQPHSSVFAADARCTSRQTGRFRDETLREPKIKALIQIVTPRTFARWVNSETEREEPAKKGRPRTAEHIRELILKIASETGYE